MCNLVLTMSPRREHIHTQTSLTLHGWTVSSKLIPPPHIPLNLQWQQSIQEHVIGCHLLLLQRKALKMSEWSTEKGEELLLRISTLLRHNKHHQLKMNSPRRAPRVGAVQKIKWKILFLDGCYRKWLRLFLLVGADETPELLFRAF